MADGLDGDFVALDKHERVKDGQQDSKTISLKSLKLMAQLRLQIFCKSESSRINFDISNSEVAPVLREELQLYMVTRFDVLRKQY
jgi:SecD/SecF fusion protein